MQRPTCFVWPIWPHTRLTILPDFSWVREYAESDCHMYHHFIGLYPLPVRGFLCAKIPYPQQPLQTVHMDECGRTGKKNESRPVEKQSSRLLWLQQMSSAKGKRSSHPYCQKNGYGQINFRTQAPDLLSNFHLSPYFVFSHKEKKIFSYILKSLCAAHILSTH